MTLVAEALIIGKKNYLMLDLIHQLFNLYITPLFVTSRG